MLEATVDARRRKNQALRHTGAEINDPFSNRKGLAVARVRHNVCGCGIHKRFAGEIIIDISSLYLIGNFAARVCGKRGRERPKVAIDF